MKLMTKKENIIEEHSTLGKSFKFNAKIFNGTNKFHMAFCILLGIIVIHFIGYLVIKANPVPHSVWRFPLELFLGYLIGFFTYAYATRKNTIMLHHNIMTISNNTGITDIKIEDIDNIAYDSLAILSATGVHFFSYYLYAEVKGKKIRLHKGYITNAMAEYIIQRINLGK